MDLFNRNAVDGGLGFGEALENGGGVLFGAGGNTGAVDDGQDVGEMAVLLRLGAKMDLKFRRREPVALGFFNFKMGADGKRI